MNRFFAKRAGVIWAGMIIASILFLLGLLGNPLNMGLCIVSFAGDVAGALRLHDNDAARYLRPEIAGLFWGAFLSALWTGEM